jgi:hypothetical protein
VNPVARLSEDYRQLCLLAAWVQQPQQEVAQRISGETANLEALADADLAAALARLNIAVTALQGTAARAAVDATAAVNEELQLMVTIQAQRITQDICRLAHQTLGYLALVDEVPGANEPLLVPAEFRRLSRNYLNPADDTVAAAEQRLAQLLQAQQKPQQSLQESPQPENGSNIY